jgi:hypothetical protein
VHFDKSIENALRDHIALFAVDPLNRTEMQEAYGSLKSSLDVLTKDAAESAFQGSRSKRKQWGEIQKELTDILDDGRCLAENEDSKLRAMSDKINTRYRRIHSRMIKLLES